MTESSLCACGYPRAAHTPSKGCIRLFQESGAAPTEPEYPPEARILRILKDLPEDQRLDVLATVCAAYAQTNGTISNEAKRNSRETVLGPLKRKPKR